MTGYARLAYVALNATDPDRTAAFYRDQVGLEPAGHSADGSLRLRCGAEAFHILLSRAQEPGLKRMAFEMIDAAALDTLVLRLAENGVAVMEVAEAERLDLGLGRAVRISEPVTGAVIEFHEAGVPTSAAPFASTVTKIKRLGHLVIKSPQWAQTVAFFTDMLGFAVSDIIDGSVCFMRCTPNPFHHSLGVGAGPIGLHHVNFMVTEIDDIGRALHRFKRGGVDVVGGPGRHPTSDSVFLYFLDPDGLTLEYSFGMEEFPASDPRPHRVLPAVKASLDTWDSERDPRHGAFGAIERPPAGPRG